MNCKKSMAVSLIAVLVIGNSLALAKPDKGAPAPESPARTNRPLRNHKLYRDKYVAPVVSVPPEHDSPLVEKYLIEGKLAYGENILHRKLRYNPDEDQIRFGLGMLQFISVVEDLMQDLYRFGLDKHFTNRNQQRIGFPIEKNPSPELLTYGKFRKGIQKYSDRLFVAEKTLSRVSDTSVKLPLHFGKIKLDLNGDGFARENETLWKVYSNLTNEDNVTEEQAEKFLITFDKGDVHWLRGYCHLLMAACDFILAYDCRETFNNVAHLVFEKVENPYWFLTNENIWNESKKHDYEFWMDLVAAVHSIKWEVEKPKLMKSALHHLESCVQESNQMWLHIMAEEDDDREWIPNPDQTGVIPDARVTKEMVASWRKSMNDVEQVLAGDLLIYFWRGKEEGYGINVRRVFLEPRKLDIVYWVQGTAAVPYLEKGKLTKMETWNRLDRSFGNQFPGYALWFN